MKWNKEEDEKLIILSKEYNNYEAISKILNRTNGSVRLRLNKLGLKLSDFHIPIYKEIIKCLKCGNDFINKWGGKEPKFCSHSCSASFNNKIVSKNKCLVCDKSVKGKNNKFCSKVCNSEYIKNFYSEKIESGDVNLSENTYRKYLIDKRGAKCENCGWCEIHPITGLIPIQMHHIDGNYKNNKLENLTLLCPNCHSLTPTHGALNKGNGRPDKRLR